MPRYLWLIVVLLSTPALSDESKKKNPWDRFNRPGNLFNTATPGEPEPACRDFMNCLGRNLMPSEKPSPAKKSPTKKSQN